MEDGCTDGDCCLVARWRLTFGKLTANVNPRDRIPSEGPSRLLQEHIAFDSSDFAGGGCLLRRTGRISWPRADGARCSVCDRQYGPLEVGISGAQPT